MLIINKEFVTEKMALVRIKVYNVVSCGFKVEISYNNVMIYDGRIFSTLLFHDTIAPQIDNVDKINEVNSKILELHHFIDDFFKPDEKTES